MSTLHARPRTDHTCAVLRPAPRRRFPSDETIALAFRREWVRAGRQPIPREAVAACVQHARESLFGGTLKRMAAARAGRRQPLPAWAAEVIAAVATSRCLTAADLTGNRVDHHASLARQEAAWALHERGLSYRAVGRALGDRTNGTIHHGLQRIAERVAADPAYGEDLRARAGGAVDELAARRRVA